MKLKKIFIYFISISFLILPSITSAQATYIPLAPIPTIGITESTPVLGDYLEKMFRGGIILVGILAIVMITFGGIQYMTTDAVFQKSEGKQRITAALGGLILALSSWIILNTINSDLISSDINIDVATGNGAPLGSPGGASGQQGSTGDSGTAGQGGEPTEPVADGNGGPGGTNFDSETELAVRQQLENAGITINKGPCADINDRNCTSVAGLRPDTINGVIALKEQSGFSNLILTGGSEGGHSSGPNSHTNGYKVDIGYGSNPEFQQWMNNEFFGGASPALNRAYERTLDNGQRVRLYPEGDHLDIAFF